MKRSLFSQPLKSHLLVCLAKKKERERESQSSRTKLQSELVKCLNSKWLLKCPFLLSITCSNRNHFCPLSSPSSHEIFPWYLIFLKRSLVFPILLFSSISLHRSLRKAFLSLLAILWNSAFRCLYLSFSPLLFASSFHSYL